MRISSFLPALLAAAAFAAPAQHGNGKVGALEDRRGSYPVQGLGSRKQEVLKSGGNTLYLAVAMLETEKMDTKYDYGDRKSGDAGNFGIFKQNWLMIRQSVPEYKKYGPAEWNAGAALNSNLNWDIKVMKAAQKKWGINRWFAGHRNGETGLNNPDTPDIRRYRDAIYWIKGQIDSDPKYRSDDTRFWVDVTPI
ncbi:hypothetical protein BGZ68_001548 [Mortierella alpina]|nr:hypothetical protein BGZ68_001548 [Mortierella alpina]